SRRLLRPAAGAGGAPHSPADASHLATSLRTVVSRGQPHCHAAQAMIFRAALFAVLVLVTPRFAHAFSGALDPFFGNSGTAVTQFPGSSTARAVVLASGGKIVEIGAATTGGVSTFALARYDDDGMLDPFFGTGAGIGGLVTTSFPNDPAEAFAAVLQPDGRVVAVGRAGGDFALARYDTNGLLDAFFGVGGLVTTPFPGD